MIKKLIICTIAISLIVFAYIYYMDYGESEVEALSRYGSSGEEVRQIQQKLKNWGYYTGNVDGIYGSKTQAAVKKFQKANGLSQDRNCRGKNISGYGN